MLSEDSLKKLRSAFNLNIYEVKVWTALLSKGVATAGELSDMSNVPRSRSYDVLESLEKKGFIIMKLGRPIRYLAVEPQEIIKRVKKGLKERSEQEIQSVEKVQTTDVFSELSLLYKQGIEHIDPSTIAGCFRGRNNTYDHILSLAGNASKEILIATTADGLVRKLEYMKAGFKKLHNNNVDIKIAAPLKTESAKQAAKELAEFATIKDLDLNSRFVLIDNKDLIFMISHDKEVHESEDTGIWVNTPFFAATLKSFFNTLWNNKK
ncbi:MAG: helix-turn-helix domain-containing protein [Candidatus Nanoarchaeia archaeon]